MDAYIMAKVANPEGIPVIYGYNSRREVSCCKY